MAFKKRKPPIGARPGTLVIPTDAVRPQVKLLRYTESDLWQVTVEDLEQLDEEHPPQAISWIDVQGLGDERLLWSLAKRFRIHPLALEDVVNIPQRPKSDGYENHHLFVVRMARLDAEFGLDVEQVSLVVGARTLLTFQERPGDVLDPVRRRLKDQKSNLRKSGSGYLAYAIIDTIVDGYFPVIETLGEALEDLEDQIMAGPTPKHLQRINDFKATLLRLRRSLWPLRDMLSIVTREPVPFIQEETRLYFRDTYDHAVQLVEVLESHREIASGLVNTYLSVVSNRTNDVMKVLTIMATIFIPLTFIAGIYGMNFEHMPELKLKWGYPALWLVMVLTALALFGFFRRKGWIGSR